VKLSTDFVIMFSALHFFADIFICIYNFLQCTIIRTTQLAAAQDRLTDLERQKDDIMRSYSPAALLDKLQSKYSEQHLQAPFG
jgi:hypothetical protein